MRPCVYLTPNVADMTASATASSTGNTSPTRKIRRLPTIAPSAGIAIAAMTIPMNAAPLASQPPWLQNLEDPREYDSSHSPTPTAIQATALPTRRSATIPAHAIFALRENQLRSAAPLGTHRISSACSTDLNCGGRRAENREEATAPGGYMPAIASTWAG
jgi:hypothetical protein